MSRRFCFTLDLKDDPALIAEYRKQHEEILPEITQSLKGSGIEDMEIYLFGTRLFMVMEADKDFSFEKKAKADEQDPKVQAWEQLMWRFQQALPEARPGEKWIRMERIFKLEPQLPRHIKVALREELLWDELIQATKSKRTSRQ
jgi:L-rhamnose mutarotase